MGPSRRVVTSLALLTLLLSLPVGPRATVQVANASDVSTPVLPSASAAWLAGLLTDGERMVSREFGIDDVDLTLDVALGLAAARSAGVEQQLILAWFSAGVAEHVGTASGATYVATAAKGALTAMAIGADPRSIGDVDLIALLLGRIGPDGRATDRGALGDLSSTASQALAVLALDRAGADAATTTRAATFLAGTACPEGGFAAELAADDCTAAIVPTALALQALAATGGHADTLVAATAALVTLLDTEVRDPDVAEGWQLGLAAQALRAVDEHDVARRLTEALTDRLDGCDGEASGALLDEGDPVRATVGVLLAVSGATLTTLNNAGSSGGATPLDCSTSEPPTETAPIGGTGSDDAPEAAQEGRAALTPVAIGLGLLVLVAVARRTVLRRLRDERAVV